MKKTDDTDAILDQEYDPHCLRMAIAQAIDTITPKMKLKVNGSNFSDWEDNMTILFDNFLENTEYLTTTTGRTTYGEKLCHSILTHSVSDTICKSIICICPCSAIYEYLKSHYHILTCGLQVLSWTNLLDLQMEEEESAMALVNWLWSKLEAIVSTYSQPPSLGQVIAAIESSTQQVTLQKKMVTPNKLSLLTFQKVHVTGDDNSVEMGDDNFLGSTIDPEALRTMVHGTCHLCKQQGTLPNSHTFINATASHQYGASPPTTINVTRPIPTTVQVRFIEMGAEDPYVMALSTDIGHNENFVGNALCDSSASHSLTGDQSALFHYKKLTKPIPLSVAIKCTGHRSYVEGMG
ncbi:hypothetical protein O181_079253 [Austropuccinia psidii MF-1]|uniref:Uncharacterized protein n=1 Tax=Austropuccinia psidii MF-1 TaxID=1389203 RepID=A0A9Q3FGC4_9BASI|nr:hypothetical protein [Austropuccinia psidii MF-1]